MLFGLSFEFCIQGITDFITSNIKSIHFNEKSLYKASEDRNLLPISIALTTRDRV